MELPPAIQKALSAIRTALPFVQRILPLLDGNLGAAVSNLMAGQPTALTHTAAAPVDLAPVEEGISTLHAQQQEIKEQLGEQNSSIKRVEDQLEMVREATDRNTLEQQELIEDLRSVGQKVNVFAMAVVALLVVSLTINVILYLHLRHIFQ